MLDNMIKVAEVVLAGVIALGISKTPFVQEIISKLG